MQSKRTKYQYNDNEIKSKEKDFYLYTCLT